MSYNGVTGCPDPTGQCPEGRGVQAETDTEGGDEERQGSLWGSPREAEDCSDAPCARAAVTWGLEKGLEPTVPPPWKDLPCRLRVPNVQPPGRETTRFIVYITQLGPGEETRERGEVVLEGD